jgi:hypothetical protein
VRYEFLNNITRKKPYSFSKINTFFTCLSQYYAQYCVKDPMIQIENDYMRKGTEIHSYIEKYLKTDVKPEVGGTYLKLDQVLKILDKVDSYFPKNFKRNSEIKISLDGELKPINYEKSIFNGVIDLIYKNDNEKTIYLVDWKSGKVKKQYQQNWDQLNLYFLWKRQQEDNEDYKIIGRYVYLEYSGIGFHVNEKEYNDFDFKIIKEIWNEKIKFFENAEPKQLEELFIKQRKTIYYCNKCVLKEFCEEIMV